MAQSERDGMNVYDRVELAGLVAGLVLDIKREGERTILVILTDAYQQVLCDPDQAGVTDRRDVPMLAVESYEAGGNWYKLFTSEINMLARYRMAVWHDYWTRHSATDGALPMGVKKHPEYWDIYRAGNIEPLPVEKDIRRSEAIRPTQDRMDIGGNRGH